MLTNTNEIECTIARAAVLLEKQLDKGRPVMMWGAPGLGKSAIVWQMGARRNRKVIEYRANLREPVDVRGIPVPDVQSGVTRWLVPDELPRVDRDGPEGYLFLDEINTASPQMMAVLFGLVLDRRVGEYTLPDGWQIIAAGNRVSDRAAAQRMPTALRNRFAHLVVLPDVAAWATWATENGVAPEMVAFVRFRRELIHRMPRGDENAFPTPRSLTAAADFVDVDDVAMRQQLFAMHVGCDVAGELNGFIELYQSLGSLEDIIADPDGAKVPTEPSQLYAVCTGLARLATRDNFKRVMTYCKRLDSERQMLLMHDATVRTPKLKETAAYSAWAVEHQDLILQS